LGKVPLGISAIREAMKKAVEALVKSFLTSFKSGVIPIIAAYCVIISEH
jgi:hypothetical protein